MKKCIYLIPLLLILGACSSAQISKTIDDVNSAIGSGKPLSTDEVAAGLKEALVNGVSNGSDIASKVDGYFKNPEIKIPFPSDVKKVEDRLRQIGLDDQVDKFILTLNRAAEDAAKEAKPIFVTAIKSMTIQDAWSILRGENNAATQYLKKTTTAQLKAKFMPVVHNSLEKVDATKYYGDIVSTYNKIPFVEKVNPDLDDYATDKAIEGLFTMIAKEEIKIRKDPGARTSELLKRVFGSQDK